jgi:hypothetical protein
MSCRPSFERTQVLSRHIRMAAKCSPVTPSFASPEWKSDEVSLRVMAVVLKKPYAIPAPINTMSTDEPGLDLHHLYKVHLFPPGLDREYSHTSLCPSVKKPSR